MDDRGLTDETTISTEIVNREPTIDYVEIVADPASNVQALLNCVVSANDPEEEELDYVYAWYQNGDLLPLETGSQLQLSQDRVKFCDVLEWQAYVEDPHEAVSSTESTIFLFWMHLHKSTISFVSFGHIHRHRDYSKCQCCRSRRKSAHLYLSLVCQ